MRLLDSLTFKGLTHYIHFKPLMIKSGLEFYTKVRNEENTGQDDCCDSKDVENDLATQAQEVGLMTGYIFSSSRLAFYPSVLFVCVWH